MKSTEEIHKILKDKYTDSIGDMITGQPVEDYIVANPLKISEICIFLRDNDELLFDNLMNLSGVDDANGENIKDDTGANVIQGGTISVFYHLESTKHRHKLTVKTSAPRENPEVESVAEIWNCANWHEREAYDLYGIKFLNHPDLRRILMPYDWDAGYPLRKDYKNPEYYQGMKVPY